MYPELPITERTALFDTVIPLSEPIRTVNGQLINEIPVRKGQVIYCATGSYNRFDTLRSNVNRLTFLQKRGYLGRRRRRV